MRILQIPDDDNATSQDLGNKYKFQNNCGHSICEKRHSLVQKNDKYFYFVVKCWLMSRVSKGILLCGAVVLVAVGVVLLVRFQNTPLTFSVQQLPNTAPFLMTADVENLLGREFRIIRRVQQVPNVMKQDFSSLTNLPFEMVNPGQEMSTDNILPNVPNKRLVFAAFSDDTAVLVFEVGAFANSLHAVVFWYGKGGGKWGAMLNGYSVHDIDSLRNTVHGGRFVSWETIPGWISNTSGKPVGAL